MKFACYTLGCKVNQYETQALEAELERIARAHHCTCMMLCSGQERIGAHEAYRRMGFSDTITKGFKKML